MKKIVGFILFLLVSSVCFANSDPVVSNVSVIQRNDSKMVDISYNLSDADGDKCTVSVQVSSDGGSTWTVPAVSFTGAVGANISSGNGKLIVWDAGKDQPGVSWNNCRIKVTAFDNYGPTGMVWVYINDPGVSGHEPFNGYMSKYETTNSPYCQYLNVAKASNQITVYNNVVYATSDTNHSQPYYNLVGSGYTYDGATNGGAARINWNGGSFTVDSGFESHPVTYVSWYGAMAFCNYYGYRLPTEWEWQAVADHYGEFTYGCGTTINSSIANHWNSIHPKGTVIVGSFGNSSGYGYGVVDMAGNVWEWTSTIVFYDSVGHRVFCGGGWFSIDSSSTVSTWTHHYPNYMEPSVGFRVCR